MKARTLLTLALAIAVLFSIPQLANAQMGGAMSGPGSGPGTDDDEEPGPRWEQETGQQTAEKGLMFRYGRETPESSVEGEETGNDISMKLTSVRFMNGTEDLDIDPNSEEWTLTESTEDGSIQASYGTSARWKREGVLTGETSNLMIRYTYRSDENQRVLDYTLDIEEPPGEGILEIEMKVSSFQGGKACCWSENGEPNQNGMRRELTLKSVDGREMSRFDVIEKGTVGTETGEDILVDTEVERTLENESAVVNIGMSLPGGSNSASLSGSLEILEVLYNALSQGFEVTAEFVIDHIYSFLIGAVLLGAVLTGGFLVASKKGKETQGKDLDLNSNRYYRGHQ